MIKSSKQERLKKLAAKKLGRLDYTITMQKKSDSVEYDPLTKEPLTSTISYDTTDVYCAFIDSIDNKMRNEFGIDQTITAIMYVSQTEWSSKNLGYPLDTERYSVVDKNGITYDIDKIVYEGEFHNTFIVATMYLKNRDHRVH